MKNNDNLLLMTDIYKVAHMRAYKEGTSKVYSYLCARSSKVSEYAVFFGLQPYIKMLEKKITQENAEEFFEYYSMFLGTEVPQDVVDKINGLVSLGYIPLEIKAVKEGTKINNKNVLATVTNTVEGYGWVVGFFESLLLKVWAPISVATLSHKYYEFAKKLTIETSDSGFLLPWLVHDFSYRGVSSEGTAEICASGHLLNFAGTDTITAVKFMKENYGATGLIGASVPASEHSIHCSYGPTEQDEYDYVDKMLTLNPTGLVSVVSDAYNYWRMLTVTLPKFKDIILARDGKFVVRPDSGNPKRIICGEDIQKYESLLDAEYSCKDEIDDIASSIHGETNGEYFDRIVEVYSKFYLMKYEVMYNRYDKQYYFVDEVNMTSCEEIELTPEQKGTIRILDELFGSTTNSKGYKELNSKIGIIYGDGMFFDRYKDIVETMKSMGYANTNLVVGVGGLLVQQHNRDDLGFAFKATHAIINGASVELFKDPITDSGKRSHKGLMKLIKNEDGTFTTLDQVNEQEEKEGELTTVFLNGKVVKEYTLSELRDTLGTFKE